MDSTVIRAACVADAVQIAVVHVRSWQGAYRGLLPQAYLDGLDPAQRVGRWERALAGADGSRSGVLVADTDGTLLGFASYSASRDSDVDPGLVGEIGAIYLLPNSWGVGVGRRLMEAALACLAKAGFVQVTLWVLDSNVRARRFYEVGGWAADGAQQLDESRGFPITQVRYARTLRSLWLHEVDRAHASRCSACLVTDDDVRWWPHRAPCPYWLYLADLGFFCPWRAWPDSLRVGAGDAPAACAPRRPPGGTVRDRGCRNPLHPAGFLPAGARGDGR